MSDLSGALGRVRVVLSRTRTPQNLGAAARALRCAGLRRWTLVDPQCEPEDPEAERLAVHAEGMLQAAQIAPTLEEALRGCALSIGATARARPERPPLSPREAAARLAQAAASSEVALVFGDERSGLTADEAARCDLLSSIPSAPEQTSWNLAHAVAIYAYEVRQAALALADGHGPGGAVRHEADPAQLAALDRALLLALTPLGREGARRRLFRTMERSRLTAREAQLWTAILNLMLRPR